MVLGRAREFRRFVRQRVSGQLVEGIDLEAGALRRTEATEGHHLLTLQCELALKQNYGVMKELLS